MEKINIKTRPGQGQYQVKREYHYPYQGNKNPLQSILDLPITRQEPGKGVKSKRYFPRVWFGYTAKPRMSLGGAFF